MPTRAELKSNKKVRDKVETHWGELKKLRGFQLTPTANRNLTEIAEGLGFSKAELLERMARINWAEYSYLLDLKNFGIGEN